MTGKPANVLNMISIVFGVQQVYTNLQTYLLLFACRIMGHCSTQTTLGYLCVLS